MRRIPTRRAGGENWRCRSLTGNNNPKRKERGPPTVFYSESSGRQLEFVVLWSAKWVLYSLVVSGDYSAWGSSEWLWMVAGDFYGYFFLLCMHVFFFFFFLCGKAQTRVGNFFLNFELLISHYMRKKKLPCTVPESLRQVILGVKAQWIVIRRLRVEYKDTSQYFQYLSRFHLVKCCTSLLLKEEKKQRKVFSNTTVLLFSKNDFQSRQKFRVYPLICIIVTCQGVCVVVYQFFSCMNWKVAIFPKWTMLCVI